MAYGEHLLAVDPVFLAPILIGLAIALFAIPKIMTLHRQSQMELGEISEHVLQSFQGIGTIQGFVAEDAFERRFEERNVALFKTRMRISVIGSVVFPVLFLAGSVGVGLVLMVGGSKAISGELSVGDIAAFATLLGVLLPPLRSLGWMISVVKRGQASLERILELMDDPVDRPEGNDPEPLPPAGVGPGLVIRNLSFAYPDEPERMVIQDLNVEIQPASVVGVFGRTGSGKTTLLRLLSRIYNPPAGSVFCETSLGMNETFG